MTNIQKRQRSDQSDIEYLQIQPKTDQIEYNFAKNSFKKVEMMRVVSKPYG